MSAWRSVAQKTSVLSGTKRAEMRSASASQTTLIEVFGNDFLVEFGRHRKASSSGALVQVDSFPAHTL
jgi:hypothetical protein